MKIKDKRLHRKIRIRKKISGTPTVPRLAVFKSNSNIYVQAIDDLNQVTLASASTISPELKSKNLTNDSANKVGQLMGEKLLKLNIKKAVFDRGGYIYHGRVKSLADGIREKGIEF
ncbi:MAG: 50S ribosomal protein L18 [Candidatus Actinomarina sp.]